VSSGAGSVDALVNTAQAWADRDPDPESRRQVERLVTAMRAGDDAARDELTDAFTGGLEFGTAGLRGALGPGPNRMNRVVVIRAAAALAAHLHDIGATGPVVVGHDARHNSEVFARDTAEILTGAGFPVLQFDRPVPTPLVPATILRRGAVAGVVVTASHNPPADNGYKVYLGDGCQIVPPADTAIAAQLARLADTDPAELPRGTDVTLLGDETIAEYVARVASVTPEGPRDIAWVHTALHGVGAPVVRAAAQSAGFPVPVEVAEQAEPDPDFPTVSFPNPEEPGAIDLALAAANRHDVDVVIANDPDADRCAVAVRRDGAWQMLTGDEVGGLLGHDFLHRGVEGSYAASVVSASRLATLAEAYGQPYVTTLTGFKWIGRVPGLVFGYEEAIGYCCDPDAVRDKDGISAALHVLAIAARAKSEGRTIAELLDDLDRSYGVCGTDQLSVRVTDRQLIDDAMAGLRARPPTLLLDEPVAVQDLSEASDDLPATDAMLLRGRTARVVVRPSGTEPKLKCYLEVTAPPGADPADSRDRVRDGLARLRSEMAGVLGVEGR